MLGGTGAVVEVSSRYRRSEREERLLALIRAAELPPPRFNFWFEGFELDAYWPEHKLAVELDSHQFHYTTRRFESDRERDVALLRAGVRTARITTRRLQSAPHAVVDDLRSLLRRSPAPATTAPAT